MSESSHFILYFTFYYYYYYVHVREIDHRHSHANTRAWEYDNQRKKNEKGGKLEIFLRMQGGCVFSVYGCTLDSVVYTNQFPFIARDVFIFRRHRSLFIHWIFEAMQWNSNKIKRLLNCATINRKIHENDEDIHSWHSLHWRCTTSIHFIEGAQCAHCTCPDECVDVKWKWIKPTQYVDNSNALNTLRWYKFELTLRRM